MIRQCAVDFERDDGSVRVVTGFERKSKRELYVSRINICCWPGCGDTVRLEVHHITPLKNGGSDRYVNFITLCHHCHRYHRLHSLSESHLLELLVYKFYQEKLRIGYCSDDLSEDQFSRALRGEPINRIVTAEQYQADSE